MHPNPFWLYQKHPYKYSTPPYQFLPYTKYHSTSISYKFPSPPPKPTFSLLCSSYSKSIVQNPYNPLSFFFSFVDYFVFFLCWYSLLCFCFLCFFFFFFFIFSQIKYLAAMSTVSSTSEKKKQPSLPPRRGQITAQIFEMLFKKIVSMISLSRAGTSEPAKSPPSPPASSDNSDANSDAS